MSVLCLWVFYQLLSQVIRPNHPVGTTSPRVSSPSSKGISLSPKVQAVRVQATSPGPGDASLAPESPLPADPETSAAESGKDRPKLDR